MSDKIITFAKTLTVGIKGYKDLDTENPVLSFMTPNTDDASYQKRLVTLKSWCTISGPYNYVTRQYDAVVQNTNNLHELSNEPISGFRIMNATSRYSTDNKFFRLIDPRGYVLEISTGNLEVILQTSDIQKGGYISEPCVWGRQGNNNILVAVSSEAYSKSVKFAETQTSNIKDIAVKDIVKFKDGTEYTYLGEYFSVNTDRTNTGSGGNARHNQKLEKSAKYYAFKRENTISLFKKLKPCAVIGQNDIEISNFYKKETNQHITSASGEYSKTIHYIFKVGTKINKMNFVIDMTEINTESSTDDIVYAVNVETSQIIRTYMSRFRNNELESYSNVEYNVLNPTEYNIINPTGYSSFSSAIKPSPMLKSHLIFIKGITVFVDSDIGKFYN